MNISVAMTTYNGERFLEEQILSVLNQTLKPAEFIVCDDGSTDNTVRILEKYQQDGKLKFFINPVRLGLINNFKKAVSLCNNANYIALSDQDDAWLPGKLEQQAAAMAEIDDPQLPCLVYSDLTLVDSEKNILNHSFRNEAGQDKYVHNLQSLLFNNFVNGCTTLINPALRHMFDDIPTIIYFNHDGWLALTAFTFGKTNYIKQPLVLYRKHTANFSIDAGKKPANRYQNVLKQVIDSLKGKDSFLIHQLVAVKQFDYKYRHLMPGGIRLIFDDFLKLSKQPYVSKKLAYRRMMHKFKI